jgi:uncharacterized protein YecE (DUF72 family)
MPDGFQFFPKFPQTISHQGLLAPKIPAALQFIERMAGLGDRLGGIFLQLPPSYSPEQLADLDALLRGIRNHPVRIGVEVRHGDWFREGNRQSLNKCLRSRGVGRVLLDSRPIYAFDDDPQAQSQRKKPQLPLHIDLTADFSFVRLISHPHAPNNDVFLDEWVGQIGQWQDRDLDLFFYVHCPDERRSPFTALNLQERLQQARIPVPALPWQQLPPTPEQLSLF